MIEYELDRGLITLAQAEERIDAFTDVTDEGRDAMKLDAWAWQETRPRALRADAQVQRRWNVARLLAGAHRLARRPLTAR